MIDHLGIKVSHYPQAHAFYERVLQTLGYGVVVKLDKTMTQGTYEGTGFGLEGKPSFWISPASHASTGLHLAFVAPNRAAVDAFYAAALAAGAQDNGAPGLRPHYHPHYYGAFVLDLDGNNIEAVCHRPA